MSHHDSALPPHFANASFDRTLAADQRKDFKLDTTVYVKTLLSHLRMSKAAQLLSVV